MIIKPVITNPFVLLNFITKKVNNLRYKFVALNMSNTSKANLKVGSNILFNRPVKFQGLGHIAIGNNVVFGYELAGSSTLPILIQARDKTSQIYIGSGSKIMQGCEFIARSSIHIGQNCLIGPKTTIVDADFHGIAPDKRWESGKTSPVVIEDNVWIGIEVMILKGVYIGKDAVVAARCVVTKDIPEGAIVAGNPMRIIGSAYA